MKTSAQQILIEKLNSFIGKKLSGSRRRYGTVWHYYAFSPNRGMEAFELEIVGYEIQDQSMFDERDFRLEIILKTELGTESVSCDIDEEFEIVE